MIVPTVKAQTLPDDLKTHWEDAMADKFPMTSQEAIAYITSRYKQKHMNLGIYQDGERIRVEFNHMIEIREGEVVPLGYSRYDSNYDYNRRLFHVYQWRQAVITDFKKTSIDKLITGMTESREWHQ